MNNFLLLDSVVISYVWLVIAILFLAAEMLLPGLFFFISFSVGAVLAAGVAYFNYSLIIQCLVALAGMVVAFFLMKRYFALKNEKRVETNVDALVGQYGVVVNTIEPTRLGHVKVKREEWPAESMCNFVLLKGTTVIVVAIKGNRLIVK